MRKLILLLATLLIIAIVFVKQKNMTWRQSILKAIYPLIMLKGKMSGNDKAIKLNSENALQLYDLATKLNLAELKNK